MPNSNQVGEVLARVEGADGSSKSCSLLDAEIYATIDGAPHTTTAGTRIIPLIERGDPAHWPAYTSSIDAALALVERKLPGEPDMLYNYDLGWHASAHSHMAYTADLHVAVGNPPDMRSFHGQGYTLPLAIIAALLRALANQETDRNTHA